jgi:uncharacterized phage protein (TIGR01671 family)
MRTIKFRGKDFEKKWIYGDLKSSQTYKFAYIIDNYDYSHSVNPDTIGQYIGLRDINEVEIYEGDIIETIPFKKRLEVIYNQGDAEYIAVAECGKLSFVNKNIAYRVIGNIHDNPELLTESK